MQRVEKLVVEVHMRNEIENKFKRRERERGRDSYAKGRRWLKRELTIEIAKGRRWRKKEIDVLHHQMI